MKSESKGEQGEVKSNAWLESSKTSLLSGESQWQGEEMAWHDISRHVRTLPKMEFPLRSAN